jgi:hypothetical protein
MKRSGIILPALKLSRNIEHFTMMRRKLYKKILHSSIIGALVSLLLISCTIPPIPIPNFLITATHTKKPPSPVPVMTATDTPTITPTQPTPTFTPTPTLIGEKTRTPTETLTLIPDTSTPTTALSTPESIEMANLNGFNMITLSVKEFYIGNCVPSEVEFTAQVSRPTLVAFVVLFVRFKSITTGATSRWTSITMDNQGAGTFTHTLVPDEMKSVASFENPWVQYQLVATDGDRNEVGRTEIFDEQLRLKSCDLLAPSPTTAP